MNLPCIAMESPPGPPAFPLVAYGSPGRSLPDMNMFSLPDKGCGVLLCSLWPSYIGSSASRFREVCGWPPLLESSCRCCYLSISFYILNSLNYRYSSSDMCLSAASSFSSLLRV